MSKRLFGKRSLSLAIVLGASIALTVMPGLTRPSAAGTAPVYWPQPWPQQWPQQGPQQGPAQSPPTPQQWQQQWPQEGPPPAPSAAPPQWNPQGYPAPQWSPQGYQDAPPPWPLGGPDQWQQQQWWQHPVGTLFSGLADIQPDDIALTQWGGGPLALWREYPVTLVDVRSVLSDDEISALLDAIDSDPIASDNSDGLSGLLQDAGVLPNNIGVVGADLVDGPPAFFVLPY